MNEFDWCEQKGRELLEKVLQAGNIKNWWFSEDQHAIWDLKYTTDKVLNIVEVKVRKKDFTAYPDWILELNKYNALLKEVSEVQLTTDKKVSAIYVNFYNDGYFSFWCLNNIDASTGYSKNCKSHTAINGWYKPKDIIPLKIADSALFGQIDSNNKVIILNYERTITKENS